MVPDFKFKLKVAEGQSGDCFWIIDQSPGHKQIIRIRGIVVCDHRNIFIDVDFSLHQVGWIGQFEDGKVSFYYNDNHALLI